MSDQSGGDLEGESAQDRNWAQVRAQLDELTKANDELKAKAVRLDALERENTFRNIGLDLSKPAVQDFVKAYEGEVSEGAVREAAKARGYVQDENPEQAEHLDALQNILGASTGATPSLTGDANDIATQMANAKTFGRTRGHP